MMDDLISRQAAIELWEEYHPYIAVKACEYGKRLRSLPSAERHGRWIDGFICSQCGEAYNTSGAEYGWNYCPNCGAKMRSIDDEVADLPMAAYYDKDWKMNEVSE